MSQNSNKIIFYWIYLSPLTSHNANNNSKNIQKITNRSLFNDKNQRKLYDFFSPWALGTKLAIYKV